MFEFMGWKEVSQPDREGHHRDHPAEARHLRPAPPDGRRRQAEDQRVRRRHRRKHGARRRRSEGRLDEKKGHSCRSRECRRQLRGAPGRAASWPTSSWWMFIEGIPTGKAWTSRRRARWWESTSRVTGGNDYAATADSDIVVFTAGFPAQAGDEPRRPAVGQLRNRQGHRGAGGQVLAELHPDRGDQSAGRDVPRAPTRSAASPSTASWAWPACWTRRASAPSSRRN